MLLSLMNKGCSVLMLCVVFSIVVVSCSRGARSDENRPMTLEALYRFYNIPSDCDHRPHWEATPIILTGYIDRDHIFDHQHYPDLPYEKFRVTDGRERFIEVWLKTPNSQPIFAKVYQKRNSPIIIHGRLAAVEMPVMGRCLRTAKVWIDDASQLK